MVSVVRCLCYGEFSTYWFETGTPTFLLDCIRNQETIEQNAFRNRLPSFRFQHMNLNDSPQPRCSFRSDT